MLFLKNTISAERPYICLIPSGGSRFAGTINEVKKLEPNANVSSDGPSVYWTSVNSSKNDILSWLKNLAA